MKGFFERVFGSEAKGDSGSIEHAHASARPALARPRSAAPDPKLIVRPGGPVREIDLPRVSIVILNLNGKHHLDGCFGSLAKLEYPRERLESLLIDNASTDGSVDEMRSKHGWVRLIVNERNLGFSVGCNQGARLATRPEVLVFLNNDMRVAGDFVKELVAPIVRGECQATTAKMWSWDGKLLNSAGGGMNFHGVGIQRGYLELPGPDYDVPMKSLFACGGAMAMRADVFAESGGFDEEFFAYYEDVDLGWRTWVLGHETHYAPRAQCWHHHSSTSRRLPPETIRLLQTRNPLLACVKNYDDENLRAVLAPALGLFVRRMWVASGLHAHESEFRIELLTNPAHGGALRRFLERAHEKLAEDAPMRRLAAADLIGVNDLLGRWEHWMKRRSEVQRRRKRSDAEIFELFLKPRWCIEGEAGYAELQKGMSEFFGLTRILPEDSLPDPKG